MLEAYIARAAQAQEAMNCLTEGTFRLCLDYSKLDRNDNAGLLSDTRDEIVFFEQAKQDARNLDDEFAATGRLKGPLHGVPISVKDQCTYSLALIFLKGVNEVRTVNVKGFDSTIGYTQWANKPAEEDAAVRFVCQLLHSLQTHLFRTRPCCIGRLDAPRSRRHHLHQDERPTDTARL